MSGLTLTQVDADALNLFRTFDTCLDGPADQPVGVAVSGGGDSVALLYALARWGRRPLHVFCVDHGIHPASAGWTDGVARHARAAGAKFTPLRWEGDKPRTGVSAKARDARHALVAEEARQNGVRVLCLAHTADDLAEVEIMRSEGSNVGRPQVWSPAPVWPQGRGVFLFRPFLNQRRAALREDLRAQGIHWIDDPANEDRASLRVRARHALAGQVPVLSPLEPPQKTDISALLRDEDTLGALGMLVFDSEAFQALPGDVALRRLATAVVCAGGGNRLPRRESLDRLRAGLFSGNAHTLSGARIHGDDRRIEIVREAGELDRHALPPMPLAAGSEKVWDGRFAIHADRASTVHPSGEVRSGLSDTDRAALRALPAALRAILPVVENGNQKKLLAANAPLTEKGYMGYDCVNWVLYRFLAASGAFACESDLCAAMEKAQ